MWGDEEPGVDSFSNRKLFQQFFAFVKSSLRPQGRFTFFNAMPDPIPTESGELDGEVLLLLGADDADKSLESLNP